MIMKKDKILLSEEPTAYSEWLFVRATVAFSLLMIHLTVSLMVVRWISENATELFEIPLDMLRTSISRNVHSVYH